VPVLLLKLDSLVVGYWLGNGHCPYPPPHRRASGKSDNRKSPVMASSWQSIIRTWPACSRTP
jgi:hypothetical protein